MTAGAAVAGRDAVRATLRLYVPLASAVVVLTVLLSEPADWRPFDVFVALLVMGIASRIAHLMVGDITIDLSTANVALAAALLGPAPGVLIGAVATALLAVRMRKPAHHTLVNLVSTACFPLSAGCIMAVALQESWAVPGESSFLLWIYVASLVGTILNFTSLLPSCAIDGIPIREVVRSSLVAGIPMELCTISIAAGTAHAYVTIGFEAILALALFIGTLMWLLTLLTRSERQRDTAEQRERQRIAEALHDDALSQLAVVGQDLAEALNGDMESRDRTLAGLTGAIESLRGLLRRLDESAEVAALEVALHESAATSRVPVHVSVEPQLAGLRDAELIASARELLRNAQTHAEASTVWVTVTNGNGGGHITLEVADDGRGGPVDRDAAVADGHFGLALVARRAEARAGSFTLGERAGGGLVATLVLCLEPTLPPAD